MLKGAMKRLSPQFQMFTDVHELRKGNAIVQAQEYERLKAHIGAWTPENIDLVGYKVYSQTDEGGIIDAIFSSISSRKTLVEIGVQNGVECNSLLQFLKGWRGTLIEGSEAYCRQIVGELGAAEVPSRFRITKSFVERDNIVGLLRAEMQFLGRRTRPAVHRYRRERPPLH